LDSLRPSDDRLGAKSVQSDAHICEKFQAALRLLMKNRTMQGIPTPKKLPSNATFGWFFVAVFSAVAAYAFWSGWSAVSLVTLIAAISLALATLLSPQLLAPLNRLWYGLGMLLGKIISPIVLGLIFFVLITPVSLVTRLFERDELKMKKRNVESYWVDRSPPGPPSDSFKNQY
jgi:hypothetical protein